MKNVLRRHVVWSALPLLLLLVTGCEGTASGLEAGPEGLQLGNAVLDGETDVVLRTDADAYEQGAPMTLTLEHQGGERVGYNMCVHGLERRTGDAWTSVELERVCTTHLIMLEAGQTATYEATVPAGLASGEYRVRVPLYLPGREEQRDVVSGTFQLNG